MSHTICLLPGDGIGPEVSQAAREVLDASGAAIDWIELPAGAGAVAAHGDVLPQHTLDTLAQYRLALKGPLTTPIGGGFGSINVRLRQYFHLYAARTPKGSTAASSTRSSLA
jgi:isocitrate dehydrogenase (NAD+)